ncbi:MAG: hypothetical protein ABEI86_14555, partial [Halobacteriaceae archaeon]
LSKEGRSTDKFYSVPEILKLPRIDFTYLYHHCVMDNELKVEKAELQDDFDVANEVKILKYLNTNGREFGNPSE